ncbi:MAG: hypothetical protein AAGA56_13995 [Myxococcota bacterium]
MAWLPHRDRGALAQRATERKTQRSGDAVRRHSSTMSDRSGIIGSALSFAIAVHVSIAGCGAPTLRGNVYRGEGYAYEFRPPDSPWRRMEASPALAYRHEELGATMMVHGRCGQDGDDVPLQALHNHLFLQFTDRDVHTQKAIPFDGRRALRTELTASLDGVPMRYDVLVLKKDGCVFDMLYLAPDDRRFTDGHGAFDALVQAFRTIDTGDDV